MEEAIDRPQPGEPILIGGDFISDALSSLAKAREYAKVLANSKAIDKHLFGSPETILHLIQYGKDLGMNPSQSLNDLYFRNGKIAITGDAAKSLIFATDLVDEWKEEEIEENGIYTYRISASRKDNGVTLSKEYSLKNAMDHGLLISGEDVSVKPELADNPWYTYPKRMCMYRALGYLSRDLFPDVMKGLKTLEEVADYPIDRTKVKSATGHDVTVEKSEIKEGQSESLSANALKTSTEKDPLKDNHLSVVPNQPGKPMEPSKEFEEQPVAPVDTEATPQPPADPTQETAPPAPSAPATNYTGPDIGQDMVKMFTETELIAMKTDTRIQNIQRVRGLQPILEATKDKKNTNKKIREIILAQQEGRLAEFVLNKYGPEHQQLIPQSPFEKKAEEQPAAPEATPGVPGPEAGAPVETAQATEEPPAVPAQPATVPAEPTPAQPAQVPTQATAPTQAPPAQEPIPAQPAQTAPVSGPAETATEPVPVQKGELQFNITPLPASGQREWDDMEALYRNVIAYGADDLFINKKSAELGYPFQNGEDLVTNATTQQVLAVLNSVK